MQIEAFRYFIALSKTGSLNKAAQSALISQQGLNKAITTLENELGIALIERSHSGISLTPAGHIFLEHATKIFDEYKCLMDELYSSKSEQLEEVAPTVVMTTGYTSAMLGSLSAIRSPFDNVIIRESSFEDIWNDALESNGDKLYFVELHPSTNQRIADEPRLAFKTLFTTTIGVAWREGFPLADQERIHRVDLANIAIAYNAQKELNAMIGRLFADHPLQNVQLKTSTVRLLVEFARGSSGALMDSYGFGVCALDPMIPTESLHFTPLATPEARIPVGFLFRQSARLTPQSRRVLDHARQLFEEVDLGIL